MTSTDFTTWTEAPDLWPDLEDGRPAKLGELVVDPLGGFVATRSFEPPILITATNTQELEPEGFGRIARSIDALFGQGDGFVLISSNDSEPIKTNLWRSPNGMDWTLSESDDEHTPIHVSYAGDQLVSYGVSAENQAAVTVFHRNRGSVQMSPRDLADPALTSALRLTPIRTAEASRRELLVTTISADEYSSVSYAFVDLRRPDLVELFTVESELTPKAVCPELANRAITVALRDPDDVGSLLEVWSDAFGQENAYVGQARLVGSSHDLDHIFFASCSQFGTGLALTGGICETPDDGISRDSCQAGLWLSADGIVWSEHPAMDRLAEGNQYATFRSTSTDQATFVVALSKENQHGSLWLVTSDHALPVPDEVFSLEAFDISRVAVHDGRITVVARDGLFVGDLATVIGRTREEAGLPPLSSDEELIIHVPVDAETVADQGAIVAQSTPEAATQVPPATAAPAAPPAPPTPFPPAPTAEATVAPAAPATVPTCLPGQLTISGACRCSGGRLYDDGGQCKIRCRGSEQPDGFGGCLRSDGTSVDSGAGANSSGSTSSSDGSLGTVTSGATLTCTTITDPATGVISESCEVTN